MPELLVLIEAEGPNRRSDCELVSFSSEGLASQWCVLRAGTVEAEEDLRGEESEEEVEVRLVEADVELFCFFAS